jgi:Family of unknown function (DUF6496)
MPEQDVIERAHRDAEQGKSPSTQAGEFVREEFEHIRQGKHGARSPQQAIAIGLSKARRAGVKLPPPKRGRTSKKTQVQARRDTAKGRRRGHRRVSPRRSRAVSGALRRESRASASHSAISRQARSSARRRGAADRRRAARTAVRTKGHAGLRRAARKASRTRSRHSGRSRRAKRQ